MREEPKMLGAENDLFGVAMCNLRFRATFKGISSEVQCKFRDLSKQRCHEDNYDCVLQYGVRSSHGPGFLNDLYIYGDST